MSVLTDEELEILAGDGSNDDYHFARAIEAAILAKIAAKELPEPYGWAKQSEIEQHARFGGSVNLWRKQYDNDTTFFTATQLHEAHAQGFAAGAAAQLNAEPVAVMHRGELCIKSTDDDQSFGMLCPTTISEGTELYTRREASK